MKRTAVLVLALGSVMAGVELLPGAINNLGVKGLRLQVHEAQAIVGRPLTPVSVAGCARRTTRRMIIMTSVYVPAPPPQSTIVVIDGTTLYQNGNTYYQKSGNQYVVVNVQ